MSHEHGHHAKTLPADLSAPGFVSSWQKNWLIAGIVLGLASLVFLRIDLDHFLRAYVLGFMMCFTFAIGGLALLMVQYVSGGKWGLLLRRPLEAMTRTLPLIVVMFLPIALGMKRLYLWAKFTDVKAALAAHLITGVQAHAIAYKRPMLNPHGFLIRAVVYFLIFGIYIWILNKWSLQRDADKDLNYDKWRIKFENISGFGIVVYSLVLTGASIDWIMSMDPTWYSSVWGLVFLVAQGYAVLALSILTVIWLSKAEPMKTILRTTEQHDLGKLAFAFVMLNIYLNFSQYLIIWSGNMPDEINWYLDRFRGGWGIIITLDFIFHWVVPFTLLLARDLKRNKAKLATVCGFMIFARMWDFFWLIEPNFADSRRNLHWSPGMLAYLVVPAALMCLWFAYYCIQLKARPLVVVNDPHLEEILEPEHAHA
ncbi:MAG: hypothetical protein ACYC46_04610 [Acidobacteriaceae bacterium]